MINIITATNSKILNDELKKEKDVQVLYKDVLYKEGILEILEKDSKIDYIIIDESLSGEIELNCLIEKILEKNKKIKIIITIKKEKKDIANINNKKIIKIFYEGKINLQKIKHYKKMEYKRNNNNKEKNYIKIEEKNINAKIISIFGEAKSGKSIFIINLVHYLSSENYKILVVDLNEESPSALSQYLCKKTNSIIKKRIKKSYKKTLGTFYIKYINESILKNKIIIINKNINILFYNKIINFKFIEKIKKEYNYIIIENNLIKNKIINKKIIKNAYKNIIIIRPNLLGIKNSKKIIEKNRLNKGCNLKIVINNSNENLIDKEIIKNIYRKNKIIGNINNKKFKI